MPKNKIALAGAAALGAAALAFSTVPAGGQTTTAEAAAPAQVAYSSEPIKDVKAEVTDQLAGASLKIEAIAAQKKAAAEAAAKKKAAAEKKAAAQAAAEKMAELRREAKAAANRSVERIEFQTVAAKTVAAKKSYGNNLDGWIREALSIMKAQGIPGTYNGLHRNIMRESSGNPNAINNWDINARNGIPSKGLLQVIPPTFKAYHVPGTSWNIYDPVANITAAANYAADRYGSIDNVFSAY
ncbi:transglycosylase SLT domain-containing protein [Streptomyces sp. TRM72054]|uniref:transglycosylase SLT domain-containing protein n=1 Tax=Streptomyces TaxID=1883 RepID=UPI001489B0E3|nr:MULTISPECIES: transglycosylase SLT domain-containing protein [Streptomyces]MBX9393560.1 transglycosylase SLT domain-containing protein [Streptomyces sp. TRM72054]